MCWKVGFIDTAGDNNADPWLFRGGFFVSGIATLVIIAAVTHTRSLTARALSGPTLLWIGTRSYGLYLYHWPIYQIVRNIAGTKLRFHEFVLCMVATAIITELSYRYLETPVRRGAIGEMWKRRGTREAADRTPRSGRRRRAGRHRARGVRRVPAWQRRNSVRTRWPRRSPKAPRRRAV